MPTKYLKTKYKKQTDQDTNHVGEGGLGRGGVGVPRAPVPGSRGAASRAPLPPRPGAAPLRPKGFIFLSIFVWCINVLYISLFCYTLFVCLFVLTPF